MYRNNKSIPRGDDEDITRCKAITELLWAHNQLSCNSTYEHYNKNNKGLRLVYGYDTHMPPRPPLSPCAPC